MAQVIELFSKPSTKAPAKPSPQLQVYIDTIREILQEDEKKKEKAYTPNYDVEYGNKYEAGLGIADIAKRIRAEIKAEIKAGTLPKGQYSVTISRYSMGQSLTVMVKSIDSHKLMLNPARIAWKKENPERYADSLPSWDPASKQYTPEGQRILDKLEAMVDAYNYDGSDSMTDYYNVNFYGKVYFSHDFMDTQKALILEHME